MFRLTIAEILSWEIDYPVNGDTLTKLGAHHVAGLIYPVLTDSYDN